MNAVLIGSLARKIHLSQQLLVNILLRTTRRYSENMSCELFKGADHSKLYSKYRPTYSQEVYKTIIDYCKESKIYNNRPLNCALDVGCGPGQSSLPLKTYFGRVIGVDVSQTQVNHANDLNIEGLTFRVGSGEDLGFLGNNSVDLVTVAQALHWINTDKFYPEVKRILTPGGALVVYGYGNCRLDLEEAQSQLWKFYSETLRGYWDERRHHIDNLLAEFELPFPNWKRNDSLFLEKIWTVEDFIGYVSSWSAWQQYLKVNPGSNELDTLHNRLKKIYTSTDGTKTNIVVRFPVYMLMGKKPESCV